MKLSGIHPTRYGWRFWRLDGDGVLWSPFMLVPASAPVIYAVCPHNPRWQDCHCGVHTFPRLADMFDHEFMQIFLEPERVDLYTLDPLLRPVWATRQETRFAVTFGAELGACRPDPIDTEAHRTEGYHILAVVTPHADTVPVLAARYGCQTTTDVSRGGCLSVSRRYVADTEFIPPDTLDALLRFVSPLPAGIDPSVRGRW